MNRTSFSLEKVSGQPRFITSLNLSDAIIATGAVTFASTFVLFFTLHSDKLEHELNALQIPTISLTGSYLPGDIIFTLGLHVMACLLVLAYSGIYVVYDNKIECMQLEDGLLNLSSRQRQLRYWNTFVWRVGFLSAVLLAVTGSIKLTLNPFLHGTIAFFMFASQLLYTYLFYFKLSRHLTSNDSILRLQRVSLLCLPVVIAVYIIAGIVLAVCWTYTCRSFAVNVHVALEYVVTVALALYIHSFRQDLSDMSWAVVLDDEADK